MTRKKRTIAEYNANQIEFERLSKINDSLNFCYDELMGFGSLGNKKQIDSEFELDGKDVRASVLIGAIQSAMYHRMEALIRDNENIAKSLEN